MVAFCRIGRQNRKDPRTHEAGVSIDQETHFACIRAGQFQHRVHGAEIVTYSIGATEREGNCKKKQTRECTLPGSAQCYDGGLTPLPAHNDGAVGVCRWPHSGPRSFQ